jgi:hypothetical protein
LTLFLRILVSVKRAAHDSFEFKIKEQIIMRGSSGIPKVDINSTSAPATTADTSAELQNSSEPYKRQKTRKPPSVREKERANLQENSVKTNTVSTSKDLSQAPSSQESLSPLSTQPINQHTAPVVSSSGKTSQVKSEAHSTANNLKEIVRSLVIRIQPAFVEKDLNQLEIVIKGLEDNKLRLDHPLLNDYPEIKEFIRTGTLKVITLFKDAVTDQSEDLLIRMIRLGCNADVADQLGNSLLIHACKAGRSTLVNVLLTEYPNLRKDWLNVHGENAAVMAHKYGNVKLYPLLEQAGISRHPENPVINFYLSRSKNEYDDSSDSETDEYLELFKENNFMNLPDKNGQTILFHAVINGDLEFVSFLCEQKQFLNVALRDVNGKSVFDYIGLIKEASKRDVLNELIYSQAKKSGRLHELANYTYLKAV